MTWISDVLDRAPEQCCSPPLHTSRCVRFNVYTHEDAQMLNFEINSGASPPGHSYSLNCGPWVPMGTPVCLTGPGPHCVLVCKPGGNENSFRITQSRAADISPPITIGEGCQDTIWVSGLIVPTIQWTIVNPGPAYNSYLSATAAVEEVYVSSPPLAAGISFFDVEVRGEIDGACSGVYFIDTVRINLVSDKELTILPEDPVICYGGTPISLTAHAAGGLPPYTYLWSTGATTQSITVGTEGNYSVQVWDATDCPVIEATTFVKTFESPIRVEVGDGEVCLSSPTIQLQGTVYEAQGGVWSGGGGLFSPSATDLSAQYTLSAAELAAQTATLTLTSTGNWGCPPASATLTVTVSPLPFVDAGEDGIVCASTLSVPLNGNVWGDATQGVWTSSGNGSFPNPNSLTGPYLPSPDDIDRGYVDLQLSSIANGLCEPVEDNVRIFFGNEPTPHFTFPQPACSGIPIQFTDLSTVEWGIIDTWEWDFGNGQTSSIRNPSTIYVNPGTYTVTLRVTSDKGCATETSRTILVSEDPVADFSFSHTCFGQGMNFTNQSTNASQWNWTFGNGLSSTQQNPVGILYPNAGEYSVNLEIISAQGCRNNITKPVTVFPTPLADFTVGTICVDNPIQFLDNSTVQNDVITDWLWNLGNGTNSTDTNPITTYTSPVPVMVSLQVSTAHCSHTILKPVTPYPLPLVSSPTVSGCAPLRVPMNNTPQANTLYQWNFGNGFLSNAANPTHTYTNTTTITQTYTLRMRATTVYGCTDSTSSIITVYPESKADFLLSQNRICSGEPIQFTQTAQNAVLYSWDFGDGNTSTDPHPSHTFENTTTVTQFYPVTLRVWSSESCVDSITKTVTVYPEPIFSINLNTNAACHPAHIHLQTQTGGQIYYWDFGNGISTNGGNAITHTFQNPGLTNQDFTVSVLVTDMFGCIAHAEETVTVYASPIADFFIPHTQVCAPAEIEIQNNSYNVARYLWDFGDGNTSTASSAYLQHNYQNTGLSPIEHTIRLDVESASGCTHIKEQKVEIYPQVQADFTYNPHEGCSPLLVSFQNNTIGAHAHYWSFGDNMYSSQINPNHVYSHTNFSSTIFEIEYVGVSRYGCSDTLKKTVTVKPLTKADFNMSHTTVCSQDEVTFTSNAINAQSYAWDFGDGATSTAQHPAHTYSNTGSEPVFRTVTLVVTSADNCTDTMKRIITVYPLPEIDIAVNTDAACSPVEITFNTEAGAQSYFWNFGDGTTSYGSHTMKHTYINYDVTDRHHDVHLRVRTKEGCEATAEIPITIFAAPIARFNVTHDYGCAPLSVLVQNTSFNASSYSWNFGDGSVSTTSAPTFTHIYQNTTTDEISYNLHLFTESSNGCTHQTYKTIVVNPLLELNISTSELNGCSPHRVDFTNNSIGVDFHQWHFGNGKTSADASPSQVYFNDLFVPQEYTVTYKAASIFGCTDSIAYTVEVNPLTRANFTQTATEVCNGETVSFTNTSINAESIMWVFPDGQTSTEQNPSFVFVNEGSTTLYMPVYLEVRSAFNCIDSIEKIITVHPQPQGEIVMNTTQGCHPVEVRLTAPSGGRRYEWTLGDGTFVNGSYTLLHTFTNQTTEDITYPIEVKITSMNGCEQTLYNSIEVFFSPRALFDIDTNIGCSPLQITYTNRSERAVHYSWDFGNEISFENAHSFAKTYSNTSDMQISFVTTLTATSANGCTHTFDCTLSVYPEIKADFTTNYTGSCTPLQVSFINESIGADSYQWHFGDNNRSSNFNVNHVYTNTSTHTRTHTAFLVARSAYNCIDTSHSIEIPVHPKPLANFTASTISACSPFETSITNTSQRAVSYIWDIDDNTYSYAETPQAFTFVNTQNEVQHHMLKLTAINEYMCVDTSLQPISVFPEVIAEFTFDDAGCSPFTVEFTNTSENSVSYLWDFGNGKLSSVSTPTNTFVNTELTNMVYPITLRTTSEYGCTSTTTKSLLVYPSPNPDFTTSASFLRIPESTISVTNITEGYWNYIWSYGDGAKSDLRHPRPHTYNSPGEYQIILEAYSEYCKDTISHFVVIAGARIYADYDSSFVGCAPLTVTFENKSRNAEWYIWDFGNGDTSTEEHPTYTYTESGTYIVELTAGRGDIRDVSRAHTVSVYDNPKVDFEIAPEYAYLPNAIITTYNKTTHGYDYVWYFGDGTTSTEYQPSHEYFEEGIYDIALAVTTRQGCYDSLMIEQAAHVLLECVLLFPNAFTPVPVLTDGYFDPEQPQITNDIFHPVWRNIIDYELQIFNRWGEMVFESHELNRGWDGHYKGELSKSGVYVWRSRASCWGGKTINVKGNVTLLR